MPMQSTARSDPRSNPQQFSSRLCQCHTENKLNGLTNTKLLVHSYCTAGSAQVAHSPVVCRVFANDKPRMLLEMSCMIAYDIKWVLICVEIAFSAFAVQFQQLRPAVQTCSN